jgi:hypothetical protein
MEIDMAGIRGHTGGRMKTTCDFPEELVFEAKK